MTFTLVYTVHRLRIVTYDWNCCAAREFCHDIANYDSLPFLCSNSHSRSRSRIIVCLFPFCGIAAGETGINPAGDTGIPNSLSRCTPLASYMSYCTVQFRCIASFDYFVDCYNSLHTVKFHPLPSFVCNMHLLMCVCVCVLCCKEKRIERRWRQQESEERTVTCNIASGDLSNVCLSVL